MGRNFSDPFKSVPSIHTCPFCFRRVSTEKVKGVEVLLSHPRWKLAGSAPCVGSGERVELKVEVVAESKEWIRQVKSAHRGRLRAKAMREAGKSKYGRAY
jgi:hypothetical protein